MRPIGTAAELERRRRLAVQKLQEGYSVREVAEFLNVTPRSVELWRARHRKRGDCGLDSKPPPGRPSRLSRSQTRQVLSWFRRSPKSFGFATELWTARRVAEVIRRKWGIDYNWRYLCSWLAKHDITPQKPQRVAREADPEAIERWRSHDWPRLQNGHAASGPLLSSSTRAACS
jgi:transposase